MCSHAAFAATTVPRASRRPRSSRRRGPCSWPAGTRVLALDAMVPNVVDLVGSRTRRAQRRGRGPADRRRALRCRTSSMHRRPTSIRPGLLPARLPGRLPSRLLQGDGHDRRRGRLRRPGLGAGRGAPDVERGVPGRASPGSAREPRAALPGAPATDLAGGGVLRARADPRRAARRRARARGGRCPSQPPIVAVAVTTTFSGDKLARVRLAVTGLVGPPARLIDAEAQLERTAGEEDVLDRAAEPGREPAALPGRRRRERGAAPPHGAHPGRCARSAAAIERGRRREPISPPRPRPPAVASGSRRRCRTSPRDASS